MLNLSRRERLVVILGSILVAFFILSLVTTRGVGLFTHLPSYVSIWTSELKLKTDPKNYDAAVHAGIGYYNLKSYAKAETYYLRATQIDEHRPQAWNNLGNTYRELLRYEDAEKAYQRAITEKPDSSTPYLNLSNLYTKWPGDKPEYKDKARDILISALEPTKNDPRIVRALVAWFEGVGDTASVDKYSKLLTGRGDTN